MLELCHVIDTYLDYCRHQRKLNEKTLKAYSIDLTQFNRQLHIHSLTDWMGKIEITSYIIYLHKTYSPKSAKRKLASIRAFFSYLEYEEIIDVNPISKMRTKFQEPKTLPRTVPLKVIEELLATAYNGLKDAETTYSKCAAQRDIAVLELLFATGMRVSELCALNVGDVNLNDGNIRIMGKGAKERILQVGNSEVLSALNRYKETFSTAMNKAGVFFINRRGLRISEQSVRFMIRKNCSQAGIDLHITPHMFRHTFATLLLEEDVDIRYIQRMLGHSSIQTTQIYTQVTSEKQRQILTAKHPRNKLSLR